MNFWDWNYNRPYRRYRPYYYYNNYYYDNYYDDNFWWEQKNFQQNTFSKLVLKEQVEILFSIDDFKKKEIVFFLEAIQKYVINKEIEISSAILESIIFSESSNVSFPFSLKIILQKDENNNDYEKTIITFFPLNTPEKIVELLRIKLKEKNVELGVVKRKEEVAEETGTNKNGLWNWLSIFVLVLSVVFITIFFFLGICVMITEIWKTITGRRW